MMRLSPNTFGAVLMMCSMASFATGDTFVKLAGAQLPLSQILVLRGVLASVLIALLAWKLRALRFDLSRRDWGLIGLRSLAEIGASYFFLTALLHMPLANITAILQMAPLVVTLASALFFAELVGWRRWAAILIGFVGMLMIVRPGADGFTVFSIYGLITVLCVAVRDLSTRRLSRDVPSLTVTFIAAVSVLAFASVWSLSQEWAPLRAGVAVFVVGASFCIIGGYVFSVLVMRIGDVSFVAPFRYTGLLWAMILGFLVWGDWPDPLTLAGAAIVVGAGVYSLMREGRAARRRPS